MTHRLALLAGVIATVLGAGAAHADCMKAMADMRAEGRLTVGRFHDAAGRPETGYILQLAAPVCLDGAEDEDAVGGTRKLQLFSADDAIQRRIERSVGRNIVVVGQPFGAHITRPS